MPVIAPFGHPFYVMAKPLGSSCNLNCSYCYYLTKGKGRIDETLLEEFTKQFIEAQTQNEILFTWHGGEPLLLPINYYARAIELQQKYAGGRHIDNCLQTNGTLITDDWCRFFKANNFLVGVSIDGTKDMHEHFRQQFDNTLRGIELLKKHDVQWNAMATVNSYNAEQPKEFYRFFKEIGCQYLQFTPVVERNEDGVVTSESVTPEQWGNFLIGVFDEWIKEDVGIVYVQLFDATLANWLGVEPGVCSMSEVCGFSPALQPDGELYSCDHFVFPEHKLGNIKEKNITELYYSDKQRQFGQQKHTLLSRKCRECNYLFACHGECMRNRFLKDHENYLCEGYKKFFSHVTPTMNDMAEEIIASRKESF